MSIMDKILHVLHKNPEKEDNISFKIDNKVPFDMKLFWKKINEYKFKTDSKPNIYEINHLVTLFSQHDPQKDLIYSKTGFPKNLASFSGKNTEIFTKKNNPLLITKLFGLNVYLDNSDWLPSSSYDTLPKDEIKSLQMKLSQVEQTNLDNMTKLKEITNSIEPHSIFDIDSPDIKQDRFDNLINLIYALQMKQFAESICGIKKDNNSNRYLITFDPSEKIEQLTLNEEDYNELISFRDPLNSISVYDLFQEKTYSYYNANPGKDKKDNRQLSFQVGKKVQVEYDYCHHCKQRKPGEIMIQCKSHLTGEKKCTRPNRVFHVNGTTVVRRNYNEDPNEFVELTAKDEGHEQCKKFFCHFCLRGSYDTEIDNVKDKSDWVCPYCQGQCFCSRCTRNDKLLKLIAYYISIGGDINLLYDNLVTRNKILDLLNPYMVLSKIFVINNDTTLTPAQVLKKAKTNNKLNLDEMDKLIDKCEMYKDRLEEIKSYFNDLFAQAKVDKNLLYYENEKTGEYKENKVLQRKRGRSGQSKKKEEKITRRNRRK